MRQVLAASPLVPRRQWSWANHRALCGWLSDVCRGAGGAAVFDWDNTAICNDVSFATLRYLLGTRHRLSLGLRQLAELLPEAVGGVARLAAGPTLSDVRDAILSAYEEVLWQLDVGRADVRRSVALRDFRARLLWYYAACEETPGIGAAFAYPWLAQLFCGLEPAALSQLARGAIAAVCAERFGTQEVWQSRLSWRRGAAQEETVVSVMLRHGLAAQEEIRDLMRVLRLAGVDIYVVSASCQPLVRVCAEVLGYPIAPPHIAGQPLACRDGYFVAEPPWVYEGHLPHGAGKSAIVRQHFGVAPILVAGDSNGDHHMLTSFPETQVRLVIDCGHGGAIAALCKRPAYDGGVMTLVQKRDWERGGWMD